MCLGARQRMGSQRRTSQGLRVLGLTLRDLIFSSLLTSREAFHLPAEISITVAGSPLPSSLRAAFQETVTESLFVRYGSTETGTISIAGPQDHTVEGAVGKPLPGVVQNKDSGNVDRIFRCNPRAVCELRSGLVRSRRPWTAVCTWSSHHCWPQRRGVHA